MTTTNNSPGSLMVDFESGNLDNSHFGHHDHVKVIWSLIHAYGTLEAVRRFEACLKRLTAAAGHPEKYHATITYAFTFLVSERIAKQGAQTWDDFTAANPDLFEWPNPRLAELYPNEILDSEFARTTFVMPKPAPTT